MSERVELRRVEGWIYLEPGTWCRMSNGPPWVRCAQCGERGSLGNHTIAADGTVNPSLVCPVACGWHVFARLVGWTS